MKSLRIGTRVGDKVSDGSQNLPTTSVLPLRRIQCGETGDAFVEGHGDVSGQHRALAFKAQLEGKDVMRLPLRISEINYYCH